MRGIERQTLWERSIDDFLGRMFVTGRGIAYRGIGRRIAAWFGFVAIVLHALGPVTGAMQRGDASLAVSHAHAGHDHGDAGASAQEAPAPDRGCCGDCPCCIVGGKVYLGACRAASWLSLPSRDAAPPGIYSAPAYAFDPKFHAPSRSPPSVS